MERKSDEAKSDGATDGQSDRAKSNGAISLYIKIEKRKKKNSNCVGSYGWRERVTKQRATERRSDRWTERRSKDRRSDKSVY